MTYQFAVPDLGEGLTEVEVVEWRVAVGDSVAEDQTVVEVQTAKAITEIPTPVAGVVRRLGGQPGDVLPVGTVLIEFDMADPAEPVGESAPLPRSPARRRVLASPSTRKHAVTLGVDLAAVKGSGPSGRVTKADVDAAARTDAPVDGVPATRPSTPERQPTGQDEVVPLRGIRRQVARAMARSWQQVPHITEFREVDASRLVDARRALQDRASEGVPRLTYLPLFVLACAAALSRHRDLNASIDVDTETITYHGSVHIGIATASDDGLVVPVLRDAGARSLTDISREVVDLAAAVRERRLRADQLGGGTFTISNFGSYGTWLGTPLVTPPEVAIAGFGRIRDAVVAVDGQPVVRPTLPLAVSADHRLVDGHVLGAFVDDLAGLLANPILLLGPVR